MEDIDSRRAKPGLDKNEKFAFIDVGKHDVIRR